MLIIKYILLLVLIFSFYGCSRTITDYENCVSEELHFEFKNELNLYIVDDSKGKYKYSSMNFPKGEYYLSFKKENGVYYSGWKFIPIKSKSFYLTGKYKIDKPNFILSYVLDSSSSLQIDINNTKTWISPYELSKETLKKSYMNNREKLYKNTKNKYGFKFKCPNEDVKENDWHIFW